MPDVVNLHLRLSLAGFTELFILHPGWASSGLVAARSASSYRRLHSPHDCQHFTNHCHDCPNLKKPRNRDCSWHEFNLKDRLVSWLEFAYRWEQRVDHGASPPLRTDATCQIIPNHPAGFGYGGVYECGKILRTASIRLVATKKFVVGFSCADFSDPNKGAALLLESLRDLARRTEIMLLAFGSGKLPDADGKFEVVELGTIQSPRLQSIFYSACDVFGFPAESNLLG